MNRPAADDPTHGRIAREPGRVVNVLVASEARPRHPLRRHEPRCRPEWIYDSLYCARGQAENLIKLHKTQLASDRTTAAVPRSPTRAVL